MVQIDVSVIIVNYRTKDLVINCIDSVISKTIEVNYEIIVVDNNSNDGSLELIANKFPEVIYIQSGSNLGFGKANNLGIKIANGRNIFFLNSDTLLLNNAIKILSNYLDANFCVGVCGGNLFDINLNNIHSYSLMFPGIYSELDAIFGFRLSKLLGYETNKFNTSKSNIRVSYICGAAMMAKKNVLNNCKPFDPDFFLYFEETELSYRIAKNNYEIHNIPIAKIIHLEGASHSNKRSKIAYYSRSRRMFYRKRYSKIKYLVVCVLYYAKCFLGFMKNLCFNDRNRLIEWYYNFIYF